MNGKKVLLDSNIIIYLSQGKIAVDDLIHENSAYFISVITFMEVLGYDFESTDEELTVRSLLNLFEIFYIDEKTSHRVIDIRRKNRVKLPDAVICATAIENGCILYTRDKQFLQINDLNIDFIDING